MKDFKLDYTEDQCTIQCGSSCLRERCEGVQGFTEKQPVSPTPHKNLGDFWIFIIKTLCRLGQQKAKEGW